MKIEAVFFDIGNVLVGVEWKGAGAEIRRRTGLAREAIGECFRRSGFEAYELGQTTREAFFGRLKEALGFEGTTKELCRLSSEIFAPIEENLALVRALAPRYRLGIISNTNEAHVEHLCARFDFLSHFEARIYSHEVALRKPDPAIYDRALAAMGLRPGQALFIDDLEENVEAARGLGWSAIRFQPGIDLGAALRQHGLTIG